MRAFLVVLMLVFAGSAMGQAEVRCGNSERFGGKIIKVGDSERRVIEAEPDREVQLETRFGGAVDREVFRACPHPRSSSIWISDCHRRPGLDCAPPMRARP